MFQIDESRVYENDRPAVASAFRDAEQAHNEWLAAEREALERGNHSLANGAANHAAYHWRRYVRIVHTFSRPAKKS